MLTKPLFGRKPNPAHPLMRGLVGWWLFNERAGTKAYDLSGKGKTGTLTGMAFPATDVSGWWGRGLNFDGGNDKVVSMTNPISDYPFSFSVWVKSPSINGQYIAISYANNTSNVIYYALGMSGNVPTAKAYLTSRSSIGDENSFSGAINIAPNKWTHLAAVLNSSTDRRIYVNGIPDNTSAVSIPFVAGNNIAAGVVNRNSAFGFWPSVIDDVRFYNRVLSALEIRQLFANPYGPFERTPVIWSNTLSVAAARNSFAFIE